MIEYIKKNILSLIIISLLIYSIIEIQKVKEIARATEVGTELNNFKLDYVDADINRSQLDTSDCRGNKK